MEFNLEHGGAPRAYDQVDLNFQAYRSKWLIWRVMMYCVLKTFDSLKKWNALEFTDPLKVPSLELFFEQFAIKRWMNFFFKWPFNCRNFTEMDCHLTYSYSFSLLSVLKFDYKPWIWSKVELQMKENLE
jgi:hypothetical protein